MADFTERIRNNHDWIFKGIMVAMTVAIIVLVLPREAKFRFEFQKGKPWLHEDLFAPFDFAIHKDDDQLTDEEQAIRATTPPHFRVNRSESKAQLKAFEEKFEKEWPNSVLMKEQGGFFEKLFGKPQAQMSEEEQEALQQQHLESGAAILKDIYNKGIIRVDDVIEDKEPGFIITLLTDNVADEKELQQVFTLQTAYDHIQEQLKNKEGLDIEMLEELLEDALAHNINYDDDITQKVIQEQIDALSPTKGMVQQDQKIIGKGDLVTDDNFRQLESLKLEYEGRMTATNRWYILGGQVLLVSLLLLLLMTFIHLFRKKVMAENNRVGFLLFIIAFVVYLGAIPMAVPNINFYVLPFCILPVMVRTFHGVRLSIFTHLIAMILVGLVAPNAFEFVFIQTVAGIVAVYSLVNLRKRSQLYTTALLIFISYSVCYLGFAILQEGDISTINWFNLIWFAGSALLTLLAYPLMYAFEKLFRFLSDVTLMELSDTNSPLLRELSAKAPGTFQHSLQVANLAEEAVRLVGGNSLLVRTGALYHDIGKMKNPQFFIENQSGYNPHDELSYEESARVIIAHVSRGIEMAKAAGLPEPIIDFIRTHHGTNLTWYFYHSQKRNMPEQEVDQEKFRYPGPIPFSKETAILMMADGVEAASRSIKQPDAENLGNLVDQLIDGLATNHQFINANITYRDIHRIKKLFKKMLMSIYHVRVEYVK